MKQFMTVFAFEYKNLLKNKFFLVTTLLLILAAAVFFSFPRFFDNGDEKKSSMAFSGIEQNQQEALEKTFEKAFPDKKLIFTDLSLNELKKAVENEKYDSAVFLTGPASYTYIAKTIAITDTTGETLKSILKTRYEFSEMIMRGIPPDKAGEIVSHSVSAKIITTGKDQTSSFFYTYVLIFALYMIIILYGQLVATNVATEKSSRVMEILITSAKTDHLIFGKIIGTGLAGLSQAVSIFAAVFIFCRLNLSFWEDNFVIKTVADMPADIMIYAFIFSLLGYFIYAFMYGAIASLASRTEDINTTIMPVTFILIAAFAVVIFAMNTGDVDSMLMIVCSHFPLTSPMAMFVRISMGDVAALEIALSIIILFVSVVLTGYLATAIYRVGVLLYGKPPKISEVFKIAFSKKDNPY